MNLLFHDRTTAMPASGMATLTVEPGGNFTFSSGAAQALALVLGTRLALAQDTDVATRPWYLVLNAPAATLQPFELRQCGAKNGNRLLFSNAPTARKLFAAHPAHDPAKRLRLHIAAHAVPHVGAGQLWALSVEGTAPLLVVRPKDERQFLDSCPYCKAEGEMFTNCKTPECQGKEEAWYGATLPVVERVVRQLPMVADVPAEALQQPEAVMLPAAKRNPWTGADVATLRALYPTTMAKDIATRLGRSLSTVQTKAHELLLKKGQAKRPTAKPPTAPKGPTGRPLGSGENDINPSLAEKLNKMVQRLAPMKIFKMDAHEATQALKLLTTHRDKWDWVPGAAKLHERLDACYSVPA